MSWLVANWRLKLLAIVLAVGLLAAVAFSENPLTIQTVNVRVAYQFLPSNLVLTKYPTTVPIQVVGLADAVKRFSDSSAGATFDLSKAQPGPNQPFTARAEIAVPGVQAQQPSVSVVLSIERLTTSKIPITVLVPNVAAGYRVNGERTYAVCGNDAEPCQATITAPDSFFEGLTAIVRYQNPINAAGTQVVPNEPVIFQQNEKAIDLARVTALPHPAIAPTYVDVRIVVEGGSQSRTVALHANIAGTPACGYAITGVDLQPSFTAVVTGPTDAITRFPTSIDLPSVSVSGATSTVVANRPVPTGTDSVTVNPTQVRVTVGVQQSFSCAATTPTPAVPSPSPVASPTR